MPCKQDHQHPPWPTSGVHDLDIQPCETKCGWCDYEAKGASRANNLRSHARGFAHVSNPDNHSLRGITILRGKAGRKFRVENSSNRNPISTQCDAPPENSRPKDIVNSNGGMNLDVKGRKKRKDYPSSWGCPTTQIKMKERVLSIFDGPSTLWKDDTMPPDPQPTRDDSLVASSVEMSESIMHNDRQGISDTVHNERLAESPDLPTFVVAKPALAETSETQRPNSVVSEHNPQAIIGAHEPPLPSWTVSEAGRFVIEKLGMATWRRYDITHGFPKMNLMVEQTGIHSSADTFFLRKVADIATRYA